MKTSKVFELSKEELERSVLYACGEDCDSRSSADLNEYKFRWLIKRYGDHDRGTYKECVEGVEVTKIKNR